MLKSLSEYPEWAPFFTRPDVVAILETIDTTVSSRSFYPESNNIFRVFSLPLQQIRVVILGQDPYPDGNATGLCFSLSPDAKKLNPSLRNIYKELGKPTQRDLTHWLTQGCFLLNTALTVEPGHAGSHLKLWRPFTELLLDYISENTKGIAWILMGAFAADFQRYTTRNRHRAFITSHPSPLSATRPFQNHPAFLGSGVFTNVNEFLEKKIEW